MEWVGVWKPLCEGKTTFTLETMFLLFEIVGCCPIWGFRKELQGMKADIPQKAWA